MQSQQNPVELSEKDVQTSDIVGFPTLEEMKAGHTIQSLNAKSSSKDFDMFAPEPEKKPAKETSPAKPVKQPSPLLAPTIILQKGKRNYSTHNILR